MPCVGGGGSLLRAHDFEEVCSFPTALRICTACKSLFAIANHVNVPFCALTKIPHEDLRDQAMIFITGHHQGHVKAQTAAKRSVWHYLKLREHRRWRCTAEMHKLCGDVSKGQGCDLETDQWREFVELFSSRAPFQPCLVVLGSMLGEVVSDSATPRTSPSTVGHLFVIASGWLGT